MALNQTVSEINDAWHDNLLPAEIFRVKTGTRRNIGKIERNKEREGPIVIEPSPTEIDNHADTHCFGHNFRPMHWTGQECSVAPFLAEYSEQINIQICTGATAYTLETGEMVILLFGQGLWFGDRMDKSLINPYQCRSYGIQLCDDPIDPHRKLGIHPIDDCFIDLHMNGSTCGFLMQYPTDENLANCRHITMSDEENWDPSTIQFNVSSMQAETQDNISWRTISIAESYTPAAPPVTQTQDDISLHEFDRILATVSTGLVPELIMESIICKVKTKKTRTGYATITDNRHHDMSPELLSQKWGIGIEKAMDTIKYTTQDNIRSAILPLTRRYRTDFMSQRLRRLSTTWYTDTLFSTQKSILGNTCAQMFTDGKGFTYVHPMKSKAQAGEALHKITIDVGVPNTLISDGAGEQTGDNTYFKEVTKRCHIDTRLIEPYSPWQNQAENTIGIIKAKAKRRRIRRRVPKKCWDFGIVWEAEIYSRTAGNDGRTAMERITGDTPDISEWLEFEFYDLCWYWDNQQDSNEPKLGRWLGVSHRVGSALCYWILPNTGIVIARTTVQHLTKQEAAKPDTQQSIRDYHISMDKAIGDDKFITTMDGMTNFINDDVEVDKF